MTPLLKRTLVGLTAAATMAGVGGGAIALAAQSVDYDDQQSWWKSIHMRRISASVVLCSARCRSATNAGTYPREWDYSTQVASGVACLTAVAAECVAAGGSAP